MPLSRRPLPFDHPEWIFELKYDGFRSLTVIQNGRTQLISRNGNPFNSFADLRKGLTLPLARKTVLDGEIVCLDKRGRPSSATCFFIAVSRVSSHSTC
jgi:bifunctional non-homologous end joining protein LigD